MQMEFAMVEAQCRCGEISLTIEGSPLAQVYCHCGDCQDAHGAAYASNSVYTAGAVRVVRGEPIVTRVKTAPRLMCGACGTHLFTEVTAADLRSVNAYLLPEGHFVPEFHLHCDDAVLPVIDGLPHYRRLPSHFGGTGELADW
ncbi:MAG: GFA family protein [Sphingobium sp.]